jgi:hypothetical protein
MVFKDIIQRFGACSLMAAIVGIAPLAAAAQDVPSYAQPTTISTDETIHGRIRSVDGAFNISVDDDRGFVDSVELHQGTIINPTGLTLSAGMSVTILGTNGGSTFEANEIDTPYSYSGPLPTPVYYGPGYWAPGFAYGYGPSFSLAIVIGGGAGYSFAHHPFYGRPWNGHGYFGAAVGYAPAARGRIDENHVAVNSAVRYPTGFPGAGHAAIAHPPAAFAGRTFAGESRGSTYRTQVAPAQRSASYAARGAAPRSGGERGQAARGGNGGGHNH